MDKMDEAPQTSQLQKTLAAFENLIAAATAASDLDQAPVWCEQLKREFERLESHVHTRRRRIHDKLFGEIASLDPAREDQIKRLKEADNDIGKLIDVVKSRILVLSLPKSEMEQANVEQQVVELVDGGTELVYWIKDQEETVTTWFAEAFATES